MNKNIKRTKAEIMMKINCQNCGQIFSGEYCNSCGENYQLKRIDKEYAFQEILNLVGFEKGFIFTCKELLKRPGKTIQEYIDKNRKRVTKPITFVILASVIYTLISHYFKIDLVYSEFSKNLYGNSSISDIFSWVQSNYGYANLIMILPITLWSKLFFRKYKYNFYETFVVISFVMGIGMLLFSFESIINYFSPKSFILNEVIISFIAFIYMSWAIGQFYGKGTKNFFKAFAAYGLGTITFQIIGILIGLFYDFVTKN